MQFGMQFFPDVREEDKSPADYYGDAMRLISLCDSYGYSHGYSHLTARRTRQELAKSDYICVGVVV